MKYNVRNYIFQEFLDLCITYRYFPEQVTLDQKQWMYEQYNDWHRKRIGKEIVDIKHLIKN